MTSSRRTFESEGSSAALDEELKLLESTLGILGKKKASLRREWDIARSRKDILEKKLEKQQGQNADLASRASNQQALKKELLDSLIKSRERLERLVPLLNEDESREGLLQEENEWSGESIKKQESTNLVFDKRRFGPQKSSGEIGENSLRLELSSPLLSYEEAFASHTPECLPIVPSNLLLSMNIECREAEMLEKRLKGNAEKGSFRRMSLRKSCLDILQIRSNGNVFDKSSEDALDRAFSGIKFQQAIDPNVSICPYELTGICADPYCPYQHMREESILPRELLPLPPIELHFQDLSDPSNDSESEQASHLSQEEEEDDAEIDDLFKASDDEDPANMEVSFPNRNNDMDDDGSFCFSDYSDMEISTSSDHDVEPAPPPPPDGFVANEDFVSLPNFLASDCVDESCDKQQSHDSDEASESEGSVVAKYLKSTLIAKDDFWWQHMDDCRTNSSWEISVPSWLEHVGGFVFEENETAGSIRFIHALPNGTSMTIQWIGRVVDCCRVLLHSGRFDAARSILGMASKVYSGCGDSPDCHIREILHQIADCTIAVIDHLATRSRSLFQTHFAVQSSLAIVSEFVYALFSTYRASKNTSDLNRIVRAWDEMKPEIISFSSFYGTSQETDRFKGNIIVRVSGDIPQDIRHILRGNIFGDTSVANENESECRAVASLTTSSSWLKRLSARKLERWTSIHTIDENLLKSSNAVINDYVRRVEFDGRSVACLKATMLVGGIIFEALRRFANALQTGSASQRNSSIAALIATDLTICRILTDHAKLVTDLPMLELLLSPLRAASVATATFLSHYSKAQGRLDRWLNPVQSDNRLVLSASFRSISNILCSQLVTLRISLRCAPPTSVNSEFIETNILPASVEASNEHLALHIASTSVHLQHVRLHGDSALLGLLFGDSNDRSNSIADADLINRAGTVLVKSIYQQAQSILSLTLRRVPIQEICEHSWPKQRFPHSILLAGHALWNLTLVKCDLTHLPLSFGFCFPKLISLNLSGSGLVRLPDSIGQISQLQEANFSRNNLKSLPDRLAWPNLKVLHLTRNLFVRVPPSLDVCERLEVFHISHNPLCEIDTPKLVSRFSCLRILNTDPILSPNVEEIR